MRVICFRPLLYRSLSWLVGFALLLPAAQSVAVWHAYSHGLQNATGQQEDRQAPHSEICSVCLAAAGLGGGALLGALPGAPASTACCQLPRFFAANQWLAPMRPAYLSRAPPATAH